MNKKLIAILAVSTMLVAGCSSSKRVTQDSISHQQLQQAINEIKSTANAALQTAKQAQVTAQDAKVMSIKTDEKLNRVFRKAQMK